MKISQSSRRGRVYVRSARNRGRRGAAIIGVLFVLLIISMLLIGVGTLAVGHQNLCITDAQYAEAIDIAEAGVNYEIRSLSIGNNAHIAGSLGTGSLGTSPYAGSFSIICTQTDGTAIADPANPPNLIFIKSTGTVDSVSRVVRIRAKKGAGNYDYGVFSKKTGVINGNQTIVGSVGTAGTVTINGANGITDKVIGLHGGAATATINPAGSYSTQVRPTLTWPTVSAVADGMFPGGGLTWLAANNDNALATAFVNNGILNGSIYNNKAVSNSIVNKAISGNGTGTITLVGKAGGANYYLNGLTLNGTWAINFVNTAGPINIWCATSGSPTSFTINGGQASVTMTSDPTKAVRVYAADHANLTLNGSGTGRYGVYAINNSNDGGNVTLNGANNLYGSVIANGYTFNGTNSINYTAGYFSAGPSNWSFDGVWDEINPR